MWWTSSSGKIELDIKLRDAHVGYHQGQCDGDIARLRTLPYIRRQLGKLDPTIVSEELREHGAWDDGERQNHNDNLTRLLWIACGDIVESN